jgi:hypothetical protein
MWSAREKIMFKIICCGLIVSILLFAGRVKAEELDVGKILQEIKQKGPRNVINKFFGESLQQSDPLIDSISTGTKEWLEVAKLLRPESDGVETELLYYAASMALPKNPIGVLPLLKNDFFPLDWICRDPYYEDTVDISTEEKFLKEAEKALVYMYDPNHDKELDALRWQCLEGIRASLRLVEKDKGKSGVRELPITRPPPSTDEIQEILKSAEEQKPPSLPPVPSP